MKSSILILAILFLLPFVQCTNCGPFDTLDFFDIQGINGELLTTLEPKISKPIIENKIIKSSELNILRVKYQVQYIANNSPRNNYCSLLACSPPDNGTLGSKNEKFSNIEIRTLTDFSNHYKTGSLLNPILKINNQNPATENIDSLILLQNMIQDDFLELRFMEAATIKGAKQFEVKINLNTGETYSWISPKIFTIP